MDQQDTTEPTKKRKHSINSYASTSTVNPNIITVFKSTAYFKSSNLTEYKELIHRTLLNELNKYHVNITAKSIDIIESNSLLLLKIRTYNKQDYDRKQDPIAKGSFRWQPNNRNSQITSLLKSHSPPYFRN